MPHPEPGHAPHPTNEEIKVQVQAMLEAGLAVCVEHGAPDRRVGGWEMWGAPFFDAPNASAVMYALQECRDAHNGARAMRISGFDLAKGWDSALVTLMTDRPGPSTPRSAHAAAI